MDSLQAMSESKKRRKLNGRMGRRRRQEIHPTEGFDLIFDPVVAVRRVCSLIKSNLTVYVVGVVRQLDHPLVLKALETLEGVQILTSAKEARRSAHMRNFRCFRGPYVRALGPLRSKNVQGNYLIGLSLQNKVQWVYTGLPLVEKNEGHLGDALILYGENATPYSHEYLRLFEVSRV